MLFSSLPTEQERQNMINAAMKLTKEPETVTVESCADLPKALLAVFKMKNEAQSKAIERVYPVFKGLNLAYSDITISFEQEKAYKLRHGKS